MCRERRNFAQHKKRSQKARASEDAPSLRGEDAIGNYSSRTNGLTIERTPSILVHARAESDAIRQRLGHSTAAAVWAGIGLCRKDTIKRRVLHVDAGGIVFRGHVERHDGVGLIRRTDTAHSLRCKPRCVVIVEIVSERAQRHRTRTCRSAADVAELKAHSNVEGERGAHVCKAVLAHQEIVGVAEDVFLHHRRRRRCERKKREREKR